MKKSRRAKPTRRDAEKIYLWCVDRYGRSKRNGPYPDLLFRKPDYYLGDYDGHYDPYDNTIFVNKSKCTCLYSLIDTLIHEYVHYLQPVKSSFKNPDLYRELELEAERISTRDRFQCYTELYTE